MKLTHIIIFLAVFFTQTGLVLTNDNKRLSMENNNAQAITIDSDFSLDEALKGLTIADDIKKNLRIVDVQYFSFDNKLHQGQIIIHKKLVKDIILIFEEIKEKNSRLLKLFQS